MTDAGSLIGIALDVSGSMQQSLGNARGPSRSRFESLREALQRAADQLRTPADSGSAAADIRVFVYAFGMSAGPGVVDLLSMVRGTKSVISPAEVERIKQRYIREARSSYSGFGSDLGGLRSAASAFGFGGIVESFVADFQTEAEGRIRNEIGHEIAQRVQESIGPTTMTIEEFAGLWSANDASFEDAKELIFGSTPMRECLGEISGRFSDESKKLPKGTRTFLVIVSDGDPTDGDPLPVARSLREQGVTISSCYITDSDVVEPWSLPGTARQSWPKAAKLMFNIASTVDEHSPYTELLRGRGWRVEQDARLFTQVNQSEQLEEFLRAAMQQLSYA
jgi:hypothetical protein